MARASFGNSGLVPPMLCAVTAFATRSGRPEAFGVVLELSRQQCHICRYDARSKPSTTLYLLMQKDLGGDLFPCFSKLLLGSLDVGKIRVTFLFDGNWLLVMKGNLCSRTLPPR